MKKVFLLNSLTQISNREHIHFLRDYSGPELPNSMIYPPLDLAYTAAFLRKNNILVTLLDASTLHISNSEVIKIIDKKKPDFVGIPSAWLSIHSDLDLAKNIKDKLPSVKIIFSGPNVTVEPDIALSTGYVDYVALGEPEKPFLDIVNGVMNENIAYQSNGKSIATRRALLQDLDRLPFPARDLLPNERYRAPYARKNPFTTISTSRGCPYSKCTFCPTNIWYMNQVRYRSVENVIQEIDEIINKFKIYSIIFRDQALTFEQERLFNLCNEIIRKGYFISWRCFSGVKDVNKNLLSIMKKAGCYQISYGFESGSQGILDLSNKGITLAESIEAARLTKEAGIEVSGSFMLGMWGDNKETIKKTIDFAIKLNLDYAEFILATPFPSTKFYEQCGFTKEKPLLLSRRWYNRSYASNICLDEYFLHKQVKNAYKRFYLRPRYIFKRLYSITSVRQLALQTKLTGSLLKALLIDRV